MQPHKSRRDSGFTLIELLVVCAIIGIVASIAMLRYATYKEQAVDGLMESTLQAGRYAMEAYFVANDTYAAADETTLHDSFGFRRAQEATFGIDSQTDEMFKIHVCTSGGTAPAFEFDSTVGRSTALLSCPS